MVFQLSTYKLGLKIQRFLKGFYNQGQKIMHFDGKMSGIELKIIDRVSIFHDFHKPFIINRVRVSRSERHLPTQT